MRISLAETGQLELTSEEQARIRAVLLRVIEARRAQLELVGREIVGAVAQYML